MILYQTSTYLVLAFFLAIGVNIKLGVKNRFIGFLIIYWILCNPILKIDDYILSLGNLGFDIQYERFLVLLFLAAILKKTTDKYIISKTTLILGSAEKILLILFVTIFFVLTIHAGASIQTSDFIAIYSKWLLFPLFYFIIKFWGDKNLVTAIFIAVVMVALFSSIIGLIQYFLDPAFFVYAKQRIAVGNYYRVSGIFSQEYTHSYYLIIAISILLHVLKKNKFRYLLVLLFTVTVVLSFHRMSYFILFAVFSHYIIIQKKITVVPIIFIFIISVGLITIDTINSPTNSTQAIIAERIYEDTITGRLNFIEAALNRINQNLLLGIGSNKSNLYFTDAMTAGEDYAAMGETGGIHNLFISIAYFYGLVVLFLFLLFLFFLYKREWFLYKTAGGVFILGLVLLFIYVTANMTNFFYFGQSFSLLFSILIATLECKSRYSN